MLFRSQEKISTNLRKTLYRRIVEHYEEYITPLFSEEDYINKVNDIWNCKICNNVLKKPVVNGIIPRCLFCFPYNISKFELEVRNYITELISPDLVSFNDREIINPKELDIVIFDKKLAFECNGIYRHCEISGSKHKNYHLEKTVSATTAGYSLMHILDFDWYNSQNIIKSMIKHKLGLSQKLYAKQGYVRALSSSEARDFFNLNHLQKHTPCSISLGLIINDIVVAAMSFSKPRYSKIADWELLRFSNQIDCTVVGAASKILNFFRQHYSGSILSYSDKIFGNSSFYPKIGFEKIKDTPPGYRYFKGDKIYSRIKYQKHKLSALLETYDSRLTEWENMKNNGFDRIWDCGHTLYLLK